MRAVNASPPSDAIAQMRVVTISTHRLRDAGAGLSHHLRIVSVAAPSENRRTVNHRLILLHIAAPQVPHHPRMGQHHSSYHANFLARPRKDKGVSPLCLTAEGNPACPLATRFTPPDSRPSTAAAKSSPSCRKDCPAWRRPGRKTLESRPIGLALLTRMPLSVPRPRKLRKAPEGPMTGPSK